jgi:hypothetical protein
MKMQRRLFLLYASCAAILLAGIGFANVFEGHVTSITCTSGLFSPYQYKIDGVYLRADGGFSPRLIEDRYKEKIPGCPNIRVHPTTTNQYAIISTSHPIPSLPTLLNKFSRDGGIFPCWRELQIRDQKSASFNPHLYGLVFEKEVAICPIVQPSRITQTEPGIIHFPVYSATVEKGGGGFFLNYLLRYENKKYILETDGRPNSFKERERPRAIWSEAKESAKVRYAIGKVGEVRFNKTVALCMCHSRFAMRIFDAEQGYVWEDVDNVYGSFVTMVFDFQGDGIDEIVILREDHDKGVVLVFSPVATSGSIAANWASTLSSDEDDMSLFDAPVRLTLGRGDSRFPLKCKMVVLDDPKAIMDILGNVTLKRTSLPAHEYPEWMQVETPNACFKVLFNKDIMSIIKGRRTTTYGMPEPLWESIHRHWRP